MANVKVPSLRITTWLVGEECTVSNEEGVNSKVSYSYLFSYSTLIVGHSTLSSCVLSRLRAVFAIDVINAAVSGLAMPRTMIQKDT